MSSTLFASPPPYRRDINFSRVVLCGKRSALLFNTIALRMIYFTNWNDFLFFPKNNFSQYYILFIFFVFWYLFFLHFNG